MKSYIYSIDGSIPTYSANLYYNNNKISIPDIPNTPDNFQVINSKPTAFFNNNSKPTKGLANGITRGYFDSKVGN
jgi:hypothetical protein